MSRDVQGRDARMDWYLMTHDLMTSKLIFPHLLRCLQPVMRHVLLRSQDLPCKQAHVRQSKCLEHLVKDLYSQMWCDVAFALYC